MLEDTQGAGGSLEQLAAGFLAQEDFKSARWVREEHQQFPFLVRFVKASVRKFKLWTLFLTWTKPVSSYLRQKTLFTHQNGNSSNRWGVMCLTITKLFCKNGLLHYKQAPELDLNSCSEATILLYNPYTKWGCTSAISEQHAEKSMFIFSEGGGRLASVKWRPLRLLAALGRGNDSSGDKNSAETLQNCCPACSYCWIKFIYRLSYQQDTNTKKKKKCLMFPEGMHSVHQDSKIISDIFN